MRKLLLVFLMVVNICVVSAQENNTNLSKMYDESMVYDGDWNIYENYTRPNQTMNLTADYTDELQYIGAEQTLKVEYSLGGIEAGLNDQKRCNSPNATLQDGWGKDIAYCFQINNTCKFHCVWADKNITSNKINLVYHNVWTRPEEAMWWTTTEELPPEIPKCNWWCKTLQFFSNILFTNIKGPLGKFK